MSLICAIAGGSGAGKTTLARKLLAVLDPDVDQLAIDWYYRDLSAISMEERKAVNYDHPDSLEIDLFARHLDELRAGIKVEAPTYDFATHTRPDATLAVAPKPVIVSEGILLLALDERFSNARARFDYSVFIDAPNDLRLERRLRRDVEERGRDADDIRRQWREFVEPMHRELVGPSASYADRIIESEEDLDVVAAEIAAHLTILSGLAA